MKNFMITLMSVLMAMNMLADGNRIYIDDFEISSDTTVWMPVMLANVDSTRGLQFNLTLPAGLNLKTYRMIESIEEEYGMSLFSSHRNDSVWTLGMYPMGRICLPPDTIAVMMLEFAADPEFKGGNILVWKCRGSTIDNMTIYIDDDTTHVTVPKSSLMGIPVDKKQGVEEYFNLMGQRIASPDSVPVALCVTTEPNGKRTCRKVAVCR